MILSAILAPLLLVEHVLVCNPALHLHEIQTVLFMLVCRSCQTVVQLTSYFLLLFACISPESHVLVVNHLCYICAAGFKVKREEN